MQPERRSTRNPMLSFETFQSPKRSTMLCVICSLLLLFAYTSSRAQSDTKSKELLQAGLTALGGVPVSDVVLTGTASFHPASPSGPVPASLRAESSGAIEITYQTAPSPQIESHTVGTDRTWAGTWKDTKGNSHHVASHNMMTEPAWFFPMFAIQRALNGTNPELQVTYVGEETFRGNMAHHLRFIATSSSTPLLQTLAQSDLYLDSVTLLPTALLYNDHPDDNALRDIPVTVLFSDYTPIHGTLLPTHVQQLRNNALFVELHIQDIQINTHVSITPLQ